MTGRELLEKKGVKFLFTQKGFDFYELGYRFFKVETYFYDRKAVPVDIKTGIGLEIDSNEIYDTKTGKTVADISFKEVLDKVIKEGEENEKG
jgi:hypothetical protein